MDREVWVALCGLSTDKQHGFALRADFYAVRAGPVRHNIQEFLCNEPHGTALG
jgi:hypothetical protein